MFPLVDHRVPAMSLVLLVLIVVSIHVACYYPKLPDSIPAHFDIAGQPNRYDSKATVVGIYLGVSYGIVLLLGVTSWWLPKVSIDHMNLPVDKEFLKGRPDVYKRVLEV